MKYTSPKKKEEILNVIIETFNEINKSLEENRNDFNYGRYSAIMRILTQVEIYEKEECK